MVRLHNEDFNRNVHILCLNTLQISLSTKHGILRLPRHMWRFGDYAVIVRGWALLSSIKRHCETSGLKWGAGPVTYVREDFSGEWGVFTKTKRYARQKEYRFAIMRDNDDELSEFTVQKIGPLPGARIIRTRTVAKLGVPCPACGGYTSGLAAPDRHRRKRVQKKIDSRLGAGRHFQVCDSCRQRCKVAVSENGVSCRILSVRHRRVTSRLNRDRSKDVSIAAVLPEGP